MKTIRVAIYARVSSKPQAGEDKISIPDQVRECKAFIERQGWSVAGEYVDPGISASVLERPALKKLLANMDRWDAVIAWDFDRFYREKRSVAGYLLDTLDENKKQITSVKQPIPLDDPASYEPRENDTPYMLRELAGFTSGMDNRRRFRTLWKGKKDKIAQGYMMSRLLYGFRINVAVENGKIIKLPRKADPEEAAIIRRMYAEYRAGASYMSIARGLNRDCIPSATGKLWHESIVGDVLRNPAYCGKVRTNVYSYPAGAKFRQTNPPEQWKVAQGKHEAIVSEELWREVEEIRKRRRVRCRAIGSGALLSGLLRCGFCGSGMMREGSGRACAYVCTKYRIARECRRNAYLRSKLEEAVLAFIFCAATDKSTFEVLQKTSTLNRDDDIREGIARNEAVLRDIPGRMSKVFTLYETGKITEGEFMQRRADLLEMEANIRRSLGERNAELQKLRECHMSRERFEAALRILQDHFDRHDIRERKAALSSIIERIDIKNKGFKVYFRHTRLAAD